MPLVERMTIAGVGLIGGSLALAAKRAGLVGEVVGVGRTAANLQVARKRGIVDRTLWDWYYDLTQGLVRMRSGSIAVRDAAGSDVVMEWQFRRAYPARWQGPELNASQGSVAVETLELVHQGLERRR